MGANRVGMNDQREHSSPAAVPQALKRSTQAAAGRRRTLKATVLSSCESRPGVYRMKGETGEVIYVGQSRSLRARLLSYFRARGRRNKAARILRHTHDIEWEYSPTAFGALLHELRLIKQYRPRFNVQMVSDEWPRAYIAITSTPLPGLRILRRSDDPLALALFGPFRRVQQLTAASRALAEVMRIRDCALDTWSKGKTRRPGCLRFEIGTCPGPCIGEGDEQEYRRNAALTLGFLRGENNEPIHRVEEAMRAASDRLEFERAIVLRERLELLQWLATRLSVFHSNVDRLSFCYHAMGHDGQEWIYLIRRGTVRAVEPAPSSAPDHARLKALVQRVYEGADPKGIDIPTHDMDEYFVVSSWFRRQQARQAELHITRPQFTHPQLSP